jgi:Family of unknown function (DUF5320)
MPGFDRTGPMGAGSMTGGGRGLCGPGDLSRPSAHREFRMGGDRGFGRGMRRGRGFGRGLGYGRGFGSPWGGFFLDAEPAEGLEVLKREAEHLKKELEAIGKRIVELEKTPSA